MLTIEPRGDLQVDVANSNQSAEPFRHRASPQQDFPDPRRSGRADDPVGSWTACRAHSGEAPRASPCSANASSSSVCSSRRRRRLGKQALRPQQHHRHQGDAVEQELVLDEIDLREGVTHDAAAVPTLSKNRFSCFSRTLWIMVQDERPDGHAPRVSHAAQHHHREDRERHVKRNRDGLTSVSLLAEEDARRRQRPMRQARMPAAWSRRC